MIAPAGGPETGRVGGLNPAALAPSLRRGRSYSASRSVRGVGRAPAGRPSRRSLNRLPENSEASLSRQAVTRAQAAHWRAGPSQG